MAVRIGIGMGLGGFPFDTIDGFRAPRSPVTLRHLLSHTGGLPNPAPLDWFTLEGVERTSSAVRLQQILSESPEANIAKPTPAARNKPATTANLVAAPLVLVSSAATSS